MDFTGERLVPGVQGLEELYTEHMSRYLLAAGLAGGKRVLDVGCGCGYGTHLVALAGAAEAVGIDISPEAVEFARDRYERPGLRFEVMDCRQPALKGPFELITCFELIEHVNEDRTVVANLADLLEENGICLISTPNASTYVAGGEGGSNPYHCREYLEEDFRRLLKAAFSHVTLLEQRWFEGMLFSVSGGAMKNTGAVEGRAFMLPDDAGVALPPETYGPPPYFIAACSGKSRPDVLEALQLPFAACNGSSRYHRLRGEFDRRGQWARKLDEQLHERDVLIGRLQQEKQDLKRDFDERGKWAMGLDAEIRTKDDLIKKLTAENERLKKAAITARG